MRNMSCAYTEQAVVERRKHVTRRRGWLFVKVGDHLCLCRKVMGRKPGEPLVRLVQVEVTDVRRESLAALTMDPTYGAHEMEREGFPGMAPEDFIEEFFVAAQKMRADDDVTRIEWRYLG